MSRPEDDRMLEDYLRGGSDLSRRYRELEGAEIPADIDARILARAADAVRNSAVRRRGVSRSWYVGAATAAVIVLSVAVVIDTGVLDSMAPPLKDAVAPTRRPQPEPDAKASSDEARTPANDGAVTRANDTTAGTSPPASSAERATATINVPTGRADALPAPAATPPAAASTETQRRARLEQEARSEGVMGPARQAAPAARTSSSFLARPQAAEERDQAEDPESWLAAIIRLREAGKAEQADAELAHFVATYPGYPVPAAATPQAPPGARDRD
jgi:hypothetical protein